MADPTPYINFPGTAREALTFYGAVFGCAEQITGVPAAGIAAAAKALWEARPGCVYTWSGLEQHSGATQAIRAIDVLYALTGSLDVPGGNVLFEVVQSNAVDGREFVSGARPPAAGAARRPLGPAWISSSRPACS